MSIIRKVSLALLALMLLTQAVAAAAIVSTLTLPSATTAYTANQMLATSATGTAVVVPSFKMQNAGSTGSLITGLRVSINDATSTGWPSKTLQVDLWTAAPTFLAANGDRGTFLPATGSASHLRTFACTLSQVNGDGVYGECAASVGNFSSPKVASGTTLYWTVMTPSGSGVTGASKVVTLTVETVD